MSDPANRRFPAHPVVGVGAVVLDGHGRVVLVRRDQPPLAGRWSLPGGVLELGETARDGIVREVREETGLDVEVDGVVEVVDHIDRDAGGRVVYHYTLIDFLCRVRAGRLEAATDAREVAWAELADLGAFGLAEPTRRVITRAVARGRAGSAGH